MLVIELTLNIFVLLGITVLSLFCGFMIRRSQIRSLKRKIVDLEKEMLNNHADILDLQRNKSLLEQKQASKIPVITLNPPKDESADKLSDKARRK